MTLVRKMSMDYWFGENGLRRNDEVLKDTQDLERNEEESQKVIEC